MWLAIRGIGTFICIGELMTIDARVCGSIGWLSSTSTIGFRTTVGRLLKGSYKDGFMVMVKVKVIIRGIYYIAYFR